MTLEEIIELHKQSQHNRKYIESHEDVVLGCFSCFKVCELEEIEQWTDEGDTAICPNCGVDSLIYGKDPDAGEEVTAEQLHTLHKYYFS